jgi:cytoskeletal protein CcmA (bactofilin family)
MFPNKKKKSFPSIIASDVEIIGQIKNSGEIQLEGAITGEVTVQSITIGTEGYLNGDINAQEVIVKGEVQGTIKANKVVLEHTAKVVGDIYHDVIIIQEGASVQGSMTKSKEEPMPDNDLFLQPEEHSA